MRRGFFHAQKLGFGEMLFRPRDARDDFLAIDCERNKNRFAIHAPDALSAESDVVDRKLHLALHAIPVAGSGDPGERNGIAPMDGSAGVNTGGYNSPRSDLRSGSLPAISRKLASIWKLIFTCWIASSVSPSNAS